MKALRRFCTWMSEAEGPPAPVMKIRRGEEEVRRGPDMEAQREWVGRGTREE